MERSEHCVCVCVWTKSGICSKIVDLLPAAAKKTTGKLLCVDVKEFTRGGGYSMCQIRKHILSGHTSCAFEDEAAAPRNNRWRRSVNVCLNLPRLICARARMIASRRLLHKRIPPFSTLAHYGKQFEKTVQHISIVSSLFVLCGSVCVFEFVYTFGCDVLSRGKSYAQTQSMRQWNKILMLLLSVFPNVYMLRG